MSRYEARGAADGLFHNRCGRQVAGADPDHDSAQYGGSAQQVIDEHQLSEEELTDAALELLVGDGHLQALLDQLRPRIVERALAKRKERS